jgi:hypothetical protein
LKELRGEFSQTTHMAIYMHIGCHEHSNKLLSEARGFTARLRQQGLSASVRMISNGTGYVMV